MVRRAALAGLSVALAGLLGAWLLGRFAPSPLASVGEGTEEVFASAGLLEREIPPGHGPIRWLGPRAVFAFRDLAPGPATLEVRLRANPSPVAVSINGVSQGEIAPGGPKGRYTLTEGPDRGALVVELETTPMRRGDRELGALLAYVRVQASRQPFVAKALAIRLVASGLLVFAGGLAFGLAPAAAALIGGGAVCAIVAGLWTHGLAHSGYAALLPWLVAACFVTAFFCVRLLSRAPGSSLPCALALSAAFLVHGVAATSPVMVVSDAVFHAHMLERVAAGEWAPKSVTQHAQPFRIPYGSAFYAILVPFLRAGLDPVALVRWGAGISGALVSVVWLGLLLSLGAGRAALRLALWVTLPGLFDAYSAGNLSNAFGQWATLAFLAWWPGARFSPLLGAGLLALACVSHLSSAIVALCFVPALLFVRRSSLGRGRVVAVAIGLVTAGLYYAEYAGLVSEQLPRLLEGGGQGRGAATGFGGAFAHQVHTLLREWGAPLLLLLAGARLRARNSAFERDLIAYALAVAALFLPAVLSPVEVRYLMALGPVAAWLAADAAAEWWSRGRVGRIAAFVLVSAHAALGLANIAEAVLRRYR